MRNASGTRTTFSSLRVKSNMENHDPTRILIWNSCSIGWKTLELTDFLQSNKIDVAAISETHLQPGHGVCIPDYSAITFERTRCRKGGVGLFVHRSVRYNKLPIQTKLIEAVGIEVITSKEPVTIVAVYCPSQCREFDGSVAKFRDDLTYLTRRFTHFIIAGDLNARDSLWGNGQRNKNGIVLAEECEAGGYHVLYPDSPTFFSNAGAGSTLDIALTNLSKYCSKPQALTELSSDHLPVVFDLKMEFKYYRDDRVIANKVGYIDSETRSIMSRRNSARMRYQIKRDQNSKALFKRLNKVISIRTKKLMKRQIIVSRSSKLWTNG